MTTTFTRNYNKALARLQRNLQSGRFAAYSRQKKIQVWKRLNRYARQLGITIKASIATACLAAGLSISTPSSAQISFVQRTGAANPLNGKAVNARAKPAFADIDNDGDMDAFAGEYYGSIKYYKNMGNATTPNFVEVTGGANPFNSVSVAGNYSWISFVDIDNDGDIDAFIGSGGLNIFYYKNTGSPTVPVFTVQSGAANPFNSVTSLHLFAAGCLLLK